jgi:hypothetical protein
MRLFPEIVVTFAALAALSACETPAESQGVNTPAPGVLSAEAARAALDVMPVSVPNSTKDYDRNYFGKGWTDTDHNGCSTRDDILVRDATRTGGHVEHHGCAVTALSMVEPYAGHQVTDKSQVDIDHVVPLAVAWRSGARAWTQVQRVALANDPRNLLAADDKINQSDKGDKTPDRWMPYPPERCAYAETYVTVLSVYPLTVTDATKASLAATLKEC